MSLFHRNRTPLSPAKKRALKARRQRRMITIFAGIPAVAYVAYRLFTVIHNL